MIADCTRCGEPFEHPPGRFTVCPACKLAVARAAKKRWKREQGSVADGQMDINWFKQLCVRSAAEVGKVFGLSRDQVLLVERKAIRKLREHKRALAAAREEARREIGGSFTIPPPTLMDLIDIQISVGEWWAEAEHCSATGKDFERRQCEAQIGAFQKKLGEFLDAFGVGALGGGRL